MCIIFSKYILILKFTYLILALVLNLSISESQTVVYRWSNPVNASALNSTDDDFAPSWNHNDTCIYFNSTRDGKSKFYRTKIKDSFNFTVPKIVEGGINQSGYNQSYIAFYDEDKAFLSTFREGVTRPFFNLFESILTRNGWSAPMLSEAQKQDYNVLHPTVSSDGKMLVVASDKNSITGKIDLFLSYHYDSGVWSTFEQIEELNTDGNEITPYFAGNDTLYFASDGQAGPGAYDLFFSVRSDQGRWSKPNPLNELNSSFDESDLAVLPGGICLFASNRPGGKGGLDILVSNRIAIVIQSNEPKTQINLGTQFTSIKATNDLTYLPIPVTNFILSDIRIDSLKKLETLSIGNSEFPPAIDTGYFASIVLIGKRLLDNTDANLTIEAYELESANKSFPFTSAEVAANSVSSFFTNRMGVPTDRIKIVKRELNVTSSELSPRPFIIFKSNNPNILIQTDHAKNLISIEPPVLDIFVNIRPVENVHEWSGTMYFDQFSNYILKQSTKPSEQFSIDLSPYAKQISETDSMLFIIRMTDKKSDTIENAIQFEVSHSTLRQRESTTIDGIKYDVYYCLIPDEEVSGDASYLSELISRIADESEFARSIKVQFFSSAGQKRAIGLTNAIKLKINQKIFKVELEQKEYSNNLPFNRKFLPYTFRILLEKF